MVLCLYLDLCHHWRRLLRRHPGGSSPQQRDQLPVKARAALCLDAIEAREEAELDVIEFYGLVSQKLQERASLKS